MTTTIFMKIFQLNISNNKRTMWIFKQKKNTFGFLNYMIDIQWAYKHLEGYFPHFFPDLSCLGKLLVSPSYWITTNNTGTSLINFAYHSFHLSSFYCAFKISTCCTVLFSHPMDLFCGRALSNRNFMYEIAWIFIFD